jgi:hypothetical protein
MPFFFHRCVRPSVPPTPGQQLPPLTIACTKDALLLGIPLSNISWAFQRGETPSIRYMFYFCLDACLDGCICRYNLYVILYSSTPFLSCL